MRRDSWSAVATALISVALVACTSGPSPVESGPIPATGTPVPATAGPTGVRYTLPPAPSPAPTATPLPPLLGDPFAILGTPPEHVLPGITCTGSIGPADPVAIVDLPGANGAFQLVLRDYADVSHPRTACTVNDQVLQLIDAHHLVVAPNVEDGAYAVVDLPEVRYHWFELPTSTDGSLEFLAVSPSLDRIVWRRIAPKDEIHVTTSAGDTILARLPDTNPGRCGSPTDSNNAAFTRSGSALFVLDEPLPEISLIVAKASRIVFSDIGTATAKPATRPLFALWSPTTETLYFVQDGSVWQWTKALGLTILLPGVIWDWASVSPDGTHLAYAAPVSDPYGVHDTYLVDLAHGGSPVKIGHGHAGQPSFLNDRQLFYRPEGGPRGCTGPSPTPAIYDIVSGTTAPSIIESVDATWPATGTHN